jgi:hypothetical protein
MAMKSREKTFGCRAIDVGAKLGDDRRKLLVLGLLLEDDERGHDVQSRLDHRRELAREDLEGLRLDLLDRQALALGGRVPSLELRREQPAETQLLAGRRQVRRADLARQLRARGVDGGVGVGGHPLRNRHPHAAA